MKKISGSAAAQTQGEKTRGDRPSDDWIDRQRPCFSCGEPIGIEAMVIQLGMVYHARCWKAFLNREQKGKAVPNANNDSTLTP